MMGPKSFRLLSRIEGFDTKCFARFQTTIAFPAIASHFHEMQAPSANAVFLNLARSYVLVGAIPLLLAMLQDTYLIARLTPKT